MDLLSDVLRVVRLSGAFFYRVEARSPWGVQASPSIGLIPLVMPGAEHLISYHILTSGSCVGGLLDGAGDELLAGDVIVFPHGDPHFMSSARGVPPSIRAIPVRYPQTYQLGSGAEMDSAFICGFLGCSKGPFNPLLSSLPRVIHARGLRDGFLAEFADRMVEESIRQTEGADGVLTRLAELMFVEVLRHYIANLASDRTGWLAGLADPVVAAALERMHAHPAHGWSLEELARCAGTSRARLAARFLAVIGQPPMQYLTAWRMQLATNLLTQGHTKISAIAASVGYLSEASFSRAFKKATGEAPGAWRAARSEHPPPNHVAMIEDARTQLAPLTGVGEPDS